MRQSCCSVFLVLALWAFPVGAQTSDPQPPPQPHPYSDCNQSPLDDCFSCCAGHSAAAKGACLQGGLDEYFCQGQGQRVYSDCLSRACGIGTQRLSSTEIGEALFEFLTLFEAQRQGESTSSPK